MFKNYKKGFTLIEVLVVVLIIGILVGIALPQYKMAVERSKATQALTLLQSLYQSAMVYQLANDMWPSSIEDLDISIPASFTQDGDWLVEIQNTVSGIKGVNIIRTRGKYSGTGFSKYKEHTYARVSPLFQETNLCQEYKKSSAYIFNGDPGSYCNKILKGTLIYGGERTWSDVYALI